MSQPTRKHDVPLVQEPLHLPALRAHMGDWVYYITFMPMREIATRISQYEMAFRMQTSVPDLMDLSQETKATLEMYGASPGKPSFANNCLLA